MQLGVFPQGFSVLELNSAGEWPSRINVPHPWCKGCQFSQRLLLFTCFVTDLKFEDVEKCNEAMQVWKDMRVSRVLLFIDLCNFLLS